MPADPNVFSGYYKDYLKAKYNILGEAFFVNNATVRPVGGVAGSDTPNAGLTPLQPFATVDYAIGRCTASRGDGIFVFGNHAETVTAAVTLDVAGVQIIGIEQGALKPTITVNGAIDCMTVTAARCSIRNLLLTIVTTDAATALINVAAANCLIENIKMLPSAAAVNVVDCITLATGGDDCVIKDIDCRNTTVAVNSFVNIEAAIARLTIKDSFFFGDVATGGIIDAAVVATQMLIENTVFGTIGTTMPAVILDGNPTGVLKHVHALGTHTTIATNIQTGNSLRLTNLFVSEDTASATQATNIIPVLDID